MATKQEKIIIKLIETIDQSVEGFNQAIPGIQQSLLDDITTQLSGLEIDARGNVKASVNNLRVLTRIKSKLEGIIFSGDYKDKLKDYVKSFTQVTNLQNQYFETLAKSFKPNKLLAEIRTQSIDATLDSLTSKGIGVNVTDKIAQLLQKNITTGAKYTDTVKQLSDYLLTNEKGLGVLERYSKQITTDALNQYSAQYTNAVTNDLGLEWFMYTGSLIATSRTFCEALVKKKYVHKSELADVVLGKFTEFEEMGGKINAKTKLPEGMVDGTTAANFHVYRGGYNCGHQLIPVDEAVVPKDVIDSLGKPAAEKKPANVKVPAAFKNHPVKLNPEIFKGLENAKFELRPASGSHYNPQTNTVVINSRGRFEQSSWYKEHMVYHEGGHALHFTKGIINGHHVDDEFRAVFDKCRSSIKNIEPDIHADISSRLDQSTSANDAEMLCAVLDTLGALTAGKYGRGHTPDYYKRLNGKYMEVFAHASEIHHGENKFFKEIMPETYEELRKYMDGLYSNL